MYIVSHLLLTNFVNKTTLEMMKMKTKMYTFVYSLLKTGLRTLNQESYRSVFRYLDVFLRRVMTENIVFSPRRSAFVNKPGQAFRAEEYTDVNGE